MDAIKAPTTNNDVGWRPTPLLICGGLAALLGAVSIAPAMLAGSPSDSAQHPSILRIGVVPGEARDRLLERHGPLRSFLEARLGIPCKLIIPDSYEHLVRLFHDREVDLAFFGGLTFLQASVADDAVPLVTPDDGYTHTSYVLVRANDSASLLKEYSGRRWSFGPELSTSGHLMPRHFLEERGIDPESFFSEVHYSGAHDRTANNVRNGVVDVGAANARIVDAMYNRGSLSRDEVRVLWETPPYADYVWTVSRELAPQVRRQILDAFLSLSVTNPEHATILERQSTRAYFPVSSDAFDHLRHVATRMGLLKTPK